MQYSYFFVTSGFPHKTVQPFEIFLLFSHKVEIGKKLLDIRVQSCLWGEGRGWACVKWTTSQKCKIVPRLLSMIVATPAWLLVICYGVLTTQRHLFLLLNEANFHEN